MPNMLLQNLEVIPKAIRHLKKVWYNSLLDIFDDVHPLSSLHPIVFDPLHYLKYIYPSIPYDAHPGYTMEHSYNGIEFHIACSHYF